ncbi:MAG: TRAP transporter large permease [Geminicoccaceae bacterium]|nr:TRAP transporter large permease [Geminicoccaceae bacterium]
MPFEIIMLLFFAMILFGVPIAFSMIATSALYFATGPIPSFVELLPQKIFEGTDFIILTAIPFFLLAGELMNKSGMAERLMHFSNLVIGRVRGGFAYVNVLASLLFSGLTGVAVGDIAALGKLEVYAMEKAGYPRAFAAAVTVASSLVGPIIPPSGIIILYCAIMNVSVGGMFLAALIPGVLLALADMLVIALQAKPRNFPKSETQRTARELVSGTKDAALALLMPVFLIGGIVGGVMTPTEAAAVSVVYALLVGALVYRAFTWSSLYRIISGSAFEAARLLFMIGSALTMSWIFALEDVSGMARDFFVAIDASTIELILITNLLFLILGMFMDSALALILFGPVVAPLAYAAGVEPLQLGVMLVVNVTVGLATPPIGNVLFAMSSVVNLRASELVRELLPFLAIKFVLLIIIGLTPVLTTAVPAYFGFR